MRKIFVGLIVFLIILLILGAGFIFLTMSKGRICTLVGCLEGVTIITNEKFSNDISITADGETLLDLCQYNQSERVKTLDSLYLFSDSENKLKPELRIRKENPHRVDIWQVYVEPNCAGQKKLLYEIDESDVQITKTEPNGPGCGTCQNGIIDLSS